MSAKRANIEQRIPSSVDVMGCDSVSGNQVAIFNSTGIDIRELPQVMDGSGSAVVLRDGHEWTITPWEGGGGFAVAKRPQTEAEIEREQQRALRGTFCPHFSKDRLLMCASIAERIVQLSEQMRPDSPPAREVRRTIRRRLDRLAKMQLELLGNPYADSDLYAQELERLQA
ncbi:MAG: hypothetical protein JNK17_07715 [Hydrogenophaga sp.]|nr:hypothetical protein [Hydrogenophaga sp.]